MGDTQSMNGVSYQLLRVSPYTNIDVYSGYISINEFVSREEGEGHLYNVHTALK